MPIGWLDSQTLVEASDSQLFEVPVDDRTQFRQLPPGVPEGSEAIFSPDQRLAAFGSFRQPVRILDVATGREKVVIGATQFGPDVDYSLAWSSDNRSLVLVADRQLVDSQGVGYWTTLGLWVMNADGSELRKLMTGQVGLVSTEDTEAQRRRRGRPGCAHSMVRQEPRAGVLRPSPSPRSRPGSSCSCWSPCRLPSDFRPE